MLRISVCAGDEIRPYSGGIVVNWREGTCMREAVLQLWPEFHWIHDTELREKVTRVWELALKRSPLTPDDLNRIPFTLLVPNCPTTVMEHKRCVVHIARKAAESMTELMRNALRIDHDTVIAGAILAGRWQVAGI